MKNKNVFEKYSDEKLKKCFNDLLSVIRTKEIENSPLFKLYSKFVDKYGYDKDKTIFVMQSQITNEITHRWCKTGRYTDKKDMAILELRHDIQDSHTENMEQIIVMENDDYIRGYTEAIENVLKFLSMENEI